MIIEKLRTLMSQNKWDAYLVLHRGVFMSSYTLSQNRLKHLTGFTGSTGSVIVTAHEAFLFLDGRYILQAQEETEECKIIPHQSPLQWLRENDSSFKVWALDPWSVTAAEAKKYLEASTLQDGSIAWDTDARIDTLMPPCIQEKSQPVFCIDSDVRFSDKWQSIKEHLPKNIQEPHVPYLVCKEDDIAWLANVRGSDIPYSPLICAYALVESLPHPKCHLFLDTHRTLDTPEEGVLFHPLSELPQYLYGKDVFYDPTSTPYGLIASHPDTQWKEDSLLPLSQKKSLKNPWEIHHMRESHKYDGAALCRFLCWMHTQGVSGHHSEFSVAQKLQEFRQENPSYQGPSFRTISAFGANGAQIHYSPAPQGSSKIEDGLYLVDSGGQYHFGTTDITRTIWLGQTPPSLKHKRLYTAVLQGHIQLASQIFPEGMDGCMLDAIARSFLRAEGLDYCHSTGHGVGAFLRVHEFPPTLSTHPGHNPLKAHMIFSNEPGYYEEGWGGIRLENVVLTCPHPTLSGKLCIETLSLAPFDPTLILWDHLSPAQKLWLNTYHRKVYDTLVPLLKTQEEKEWLAHQTRPYSK